MYNCEEQVYLETDFEIICTLCSTFTARVPKQNTDLVGAQLEKVIEMWIVNVAVMDN